METHITEPSLTDEATQNTCTVYIGLFFFWETDADGDFLKSLIWLWKDTENSDRVTLMLQEFVPYAAKQCVCTIVHKCYRCFSPLCLCVYMNRLSAAVS